MKTLIVYFSFSGNNRLLAEHLARRLGCDIGSVVEKRRRTMFTIFMDMMFRRVPQIEPPAYRLADYERIILIAPIWGSKVASPMNSFIRQEKHALSNYAFISLCGYGNTEQRVSIEQQLRELAGHPPTTLVELKISDLMPEGKKNDMKAISRYRVTDRDLETLDTQINI